MWAELRMGEIWDVQIYAVDRDVKLEERHMGGHKCHVYCMGHCMRIMGACRAMNASIASIHQRAIYAPQLSMS